MRYALLLRTINVKYRNGVRQQPREKRAHQDQIEADKLFKYMHISKKNCQLAVYDLCNFSEKSRNFLQILIKFYFVSCDISDPRKG